MGTGSLLPLKKVLGPQKWLQYRERIPKPGPSHTHVRNLVSFCIFLDPYEDVSLGQWPGEDRNHLNLCPQLARIQTDTVVAMLKTLYPGMQFEISKFS